MLILQPQLSLEHRTLSSGSVHVNQAGQQEFKMGVVLYL